MTSCQKQDCLVVDEEHARPRHPVPVAPEVVQLEALPGQVAVRRAARLVVVQLLAREADVHVDVPGDEVAELDGAHG